MRKKTFYVIGVIIIIIIIVNNIVEFPLVVWGRNTNISWGSEEQFKEGDIVEPLKILISDSKITSAYIIISRSDFNYLPDGVAKKRVIFTKDPTVLTDIKKNFKFRIIEGDMTTVESQILLYQDTRLVFKSNIVLEKDKIGLQSSFGWMEAVNDKELLQSIQKFNPVLSPIVFF